MVHWFPPQTRNYFVQFVKIKKVDIMVVDELRVDEMGVDEMESRQSGNKPFRKGIYLMIIESVSLSVLLKHLCCGVH